MWLDVSSLCVGLVAALYTFSLSELHFLLVQRQHLFNFNSYHQSSPHLCFSLYIFFFKPFLFFVSTLSKNPNYSLPPPPLTPATHLMCIDAGSTSRSSVWLFNCLLQDVAVTCDGGRGAGGDLCEVKWVFSESPSRPMTFVCQTPSLLIPNSLPLQS